MQKKFVIFDNDVLFNDLIEEQVSIVFEKNFDIKFVKNPPTVRRVKERFQETREPEPEPETVIRMNRNRYEPELV